MYVIIIGGGRTGAHLASLLIAQGHEVQVIEHRADILAYVHHELPTEIIYEGDGTDPQVLEDVDIRRANVVAAVSSDDADNLVAASLARQPAIWRQACDRTREQPAQRMAFHT
jgi:trk system potassium uptake protein TrkA